MLANNGERVRVARLNRSACRSLLPLVKWRTDAAKTLGDIRQHTYEGFEVDSESALFLEGCPSKVSLVVGGQKRLSLLANDDETATSTANSRRMWFWWRCGEVRRHRSHRRFVCSGLLCHGTLESRSRESADGFIEARFIGPGTTRSVEITAATGWAN